MKVLKFGGSSVGSAENIEKVVEIVKNAIEKESCAIVFSAMQGTTDALIEIGKLAESGNENFREQIEQIKAKHFTVIYALLPDRAQNDILDFVEKRIGELERICEGVFLLHELSPRTLDRIVGYGEILSTNIIAAKFDYSGIENVWKDTRQLILTDSNYGFAAVDFAKTNMRIRDFFKNSTSQLYVLPGFIASDANGTATTLGRGGSDYTAAILAAALGAEVLEIWTDVSGMMTADPRFVRNVREIPRISYREAMELSHFGAKVIYPPTIQPVMARNIPIWIKNTFAPKDFGTLIEAETVPEKEIVRGISSIDKISVLNLEGSGMVGIPGFSKRLFDALSRAEINVILITQSSSEHSICVAIEDKFGKLAKETVDREFEYEINVGKIEPLRVEDGFSILALVGDKMKEHTGISGKMFATFGSQGINVHVIAQGSSERNISAIINSKDVRKAVNSLHEEFFSDGNKQVNVFIVGVGTVGKKLIEQIGRQSDFLHANLRLNLRVIGLAKSRNKIFDEAGIELSNTENLLETAPAMNISEFTDLILEKNLRNSIFVDVTASAEVVETYSKLLEKSVAVIACNKIAASSDYANYQKLKDLSREFGTAFLFETNVGAGLPIINTLNDLMRSGDEIKRIEAVLSGTLNFVFNNYDGSRSFSSVVRQAQMKATPNPTRDSI
jgi:aspartokinase/homoserine dehydrogenase 1